MKSTMRFVTLAVSYLTWPIKQLMLMFVGFYQKFISKLLPPTCRFYPSCSEYARLALLYLPLHKALYYSAWRILRCHPGTKGGEDFPPGVSEEALRRF